MYCAIVSEGEVQLQVPFRGISGMNRQKMGGFFATTLEVLAGATVSCFGKEPVNFC